MILRLHKNVSSRAILMRMKAWKGYGIKLPRPILTYYPSIWVEEAVTVPWMVWMRSRSVTYSTVLPHTEFLMAKCDLYCFCISVISTTIVLRTLHSVNNSTRNCEAPSSHGCKYENYSSGIWYRMVWWKFTDVSKEHVASIFRLDYLRTVIVTVHAVRTSNLT
jgi:hypothetical protein